MQQRADFITIATADLAAARAFYVDGLGWTPLLDVPGEIVFFQIGHGLVLGLFDAEAFERDLDDGRARDGGSVSGSAGSGSAGHRVLPRASGAAPAGFSLSHNVGSADEVDSVVERMRAAGGRIRTAPQQAAFGGYHAHVLDPNGALWEIAHNPAWSVGDDGEVLLGMVE
jgi:catechol 2,3-dioxygenase-like lactoylglutathione lyase family enzyme